MKPFHDYEPPVPPEPNVVVYQSCFAHGCISLLRSLCFTNPFEENARVRLPFIDPDREYTWAECETIQIDGTELAPYLILIITRKKDFEDTEYYVHTVDSPVEFGCNGYLYQTMEGFPFVLYDMSEEKIQQLLEVVSRKRFPPTSEVRMKRMLKKMRHNVLHPDELDFLSKPQ